jgi:WD40 repeat protein
VPVVKGERRLLDPNYFSVSDFTFSPDSRRVLAVCNQTATVWDVGTGQQIARLPPNPSAFMAGRFAPDGRKVYLTCFDKNVYAWDVGTNQLARVFRGEDHQQTTWGTCLAISPDGSRLYEGSGDNQRDEKGQLIKQGERFLYQDTLVRIIDVATGNEVGRFGGHASTVHSVGVSADGERALSSSEDSICLWEAKTGKLIRNLAAGALGKEKNWWMRAYLAADGRTALLNLNDPVLHVWDVDNDREVRSFGTPGARVHGVAFSPDGTRAVTATYVPDTVNPPGGTDVFIRLWDVTTGKELRRFEGHTHFLVGPLAVSPDNRLAVSNCWDKTVRLWDLGADALPGGGVAAAPPDKGTPAEGVPPGGGPKRLLGHQAAVTALAGSRDGHRLLSGDAGGSVWLWDADAGKQLLPLEGARGEVRSVAFSPDGRYAVAAATQGMWCWDTASGKIVPAISEPAERGEMNALAFSADGQRLLVGGAFATIHAFRMDGPRFEGGRTSAQQGPIRSLAAVPGGSRYAYVPDDANIHLCEWDGRQLREVGQPMGGFGPVSRVACAPDGRTVAGVVGTLVPFWDLQTGQKTGLEIRHAKKVTGVAFSPDGQLVLTGNQDGIARLWDAKTAGKKRDLAGHAGPVLSVAFSGDGRFAFTGGEDKVVLLWSLGGP